jgi:hypothetical protein
VIRSLKAAKQIGLNDSAERAGAGGQGDQVIEDKQAPMLGDT